MELLFINVYWQSNAQVHGLIHRLECGYTSKNAGQDRQAYKRKQNPAQELNVSHIIGAHIRLLHAKEVRLSLE